MTYPLCRQTVTVYRLVQGQVQRQVLENVFYDWHSLRESGELGYRQVTRFSLILPGERQEIQIGDRVLEGIGPQVTAQMWPGFSPATVQGLGQVQVIRPVYVGGRLVHWEAADR